MLPVEGVRRYGLDRGFILVSKTGATRIHLESRHTPIPDTLTILESSLGSKCTSVEYKTLATPSNTCVFDMGVCLASR